MTGSVAVGPALPFALTGGFWFLQALGVSQSIATSCSREADLLDAIREGAVLRVRPKLMTVAVIMAGLLPILWGSGTGSEVMSRIAAPRVGGMITAP